MINITVSGGSGSVSIDFGNLPCESVSLISPDSTPMYDFAIYNAKGSFVVGASSISVQKTNIDKRFILTGICQLVISGAADDGTYQVEPFPRA